MCYAKPGPRCSKHSWNKYVKNKEKMNILKERRDKVNSLKENTAKIDSKIMEIEKNLKQSFKEFLETKEGLQILENKYGRDSDLYEKFSAIRKNKIDAYKEAKRKQTVVDNDSSSGTLFLERKEITNNDLDKFKIDLEHEHIQFIMNQRQDTAFISEKELSTLMNKRHGTVTYEYLEENFKKYKSYYSLAFTPFGNINPQTQKVGGELRLIAQGENYMVIELKSHKKDRMNKESSLGFKYDPETETYLNSKVHILFRGIQEYEKKRADKIFSEQTQTITECVEQLDEFKKAKYDYCREMKKVKQEPDITIMNHYDQMIHSNEQRLEAAGKTLRFHSQSINFIQETNSVPVDLDHKNKLVIDTFNKLNRINFE